MTHTTRFSPQRWRASLSCRYLMFTSGIKFDPVVMPSWNHILLSLEIVRQVKWPWPLYIMPLNLSLTAEPAARTINSLSNSNFSRIMSISIIDGTPVRIVRIERLDHMPVLAHSGHLVLHLFRYPFNHSCKHTPSRYWFCLLKPAIKYNFIIP